MAAPFRFKSKSLNIFGGEEPAESFPVAPAKNIERAHPSFLDEESDYSDPFASYSSAPSKSASTTEAPLKRPHDTQRELNLSNDTADSSGMNFAFEPRSLNTRSKTIAPSTSSAFSAHQADSQQHDQLPSPRNDSHSESSSSPKHLEPPQNKPQHQELLNEHEGLPKTLSTSPQPSSPSLPQEMPAFPHSSPLKPEVLPTLQRTSNPTIEVHESQNEPQQVENRPRFKFGNTTQTVRTQNPARINQASQQGDKEVSERIVNSQPNRFKVATPLTRRFPTLPKFDRTQQEPTERPIIEELTSEASVSQVSNEISIPNIVVQSETETIPAQTNKITRFQPSKFNAPTMSSAVGRSNIPSSPISDRQTVIASKIRLTEDSRVDPREAAMKAINWEREEAKIKGLQEFYARTSAELARMNQQTYKELMDLEHKLIDINIQMAEQTTELLAIRDPVLEYKIATVTRKCRELAKEREKRVEE